MEDLAPDIVRQRLHRRHLHGGYRCGRRGAVLVSRRGASESAHLRHPIVHSPGGAGKDGNEGFDASIPLIDSGISLYVWSRKPFFSAVLFTSKNFDANAAVQITREFFGARAIEHDSF